jgi:hypothetical protein
VQDDKDSLVYNSMLEAKKMHFDMFDATQNADDPVI